MSSFGANYLLWNRLKVLTRLPTVEQLPTMEQVTYTVEQTTHYGEGCLQCLRLLTLEQLT
jgi:hypothetical protein